jgi:hypothetical protein
MLGQPYGNTTGAYIAGASSYSAGQYLHFGIDISMPCGTPVLAVADATVHSVDNPNRGSAPHNVLLSISELGLAVLYGHLLERSLLIPGQPIRQGEVVGYSGSPDSDCNSRPHLHLEVRSLDHLTAYNPVQYIQAPWHSMVGMNVQTRSPFQMDLQNPRRWMDLADQPDVRFGGPRLNNYALTSPMAWARRVPSPTLPAKTLPAPANTWTVRQLGAEGCCFGAWWAGDDSQNLYVTDGAAGQTASVYQIPLAGGSPIALQTAPAPFLSGDGSHEIRYEADKTVIRRLADGQEWQILLAGFYPVLSPDHQQVMWMDDASQLWLAALEGGSPTVVWRATTRLPDPPTVRWLDSQRILIAQRDSQRMTTLEVLTLPESSTYRLGTWYNLRTLTIAPGGAHLIFFSLFNPDPANNGAFLLDVAPTAQPQALPWFGDYRWRDSHSLFYITFDPQTDFQQLHFYDLRTGQSSALTDPATHAFTIANGEWSVASNGEVIAWREARDGHLWLLEANPYSLGG